MNVNSTSSKAWNILNRATDYIPVVSTGTNAVKIFLKMKENISTAMVSNGYEMGLEKKHSFVLLKDKDSMWRNAVLLIPVIGNLIIGGVDLVSKLTGIEKRDEAENCYAKAMQMGQDQGSEFGHKSNINDDKILELFRRSAALGKVEAMYELGRLYSLGYGVEKNDAMAMNCFREAVRVADSQQEAELSVLFQVPFITCEHEVELLTLLAEKGSAKAIEALQCLYSEGSKPVLDIRQKSRKELKTFAEHWNDYQGEKIFPQDEEKALLWKQKLTEKYLEDITRGTDLSDPTRFLIENGRVDDVERNLRQGNKVSLTLLVDYYEKNGETAKQIELLNKFGKNDPSLMIKLAHSYKARNQPGDSELMDQCFQKAIRLGKNDLGIMIQLGQYYESLDLDVAQKCYQNAQRLGNSYPLVRLLIEKKGAPEDLKLAKEILRPLVVGKSSVNSELKKLWEKLLLQCPDRFY